MEFADYVIVFVCSVVFVFFLAGVVAPSSSPETKDDASFRRLVCGILSFIFLAFAAVIPMTGGSAGARARAVPPVVSGCSVRVVEESPYPDVARWYAQVCKTGHREYADSLSGALFLADLLGHGDGGDVLYSTGSFQVSASSFLGGYFVTGRDGIGNDVSVRADSFVDAVSAADEAASGTGVRVILKR